MIPSNKTGSDHLTKNKKQLKIKGVGPPSQHEIKVPPPGNAPHSTPWSPGIVVLSLGSPALQQGF